MGREKISTPGPGSGGTPAVPPDLISTAALAELAGCTPQTLRHYAAMGCPHQRDKTRLLFPREAALEWIAGSAVGRLPGAHGGGRPGGGRKSKSDRAKSENQNRASGIGHPAADGNPTVREGVSGGAAPPPRRLVPSAAVERATFRAPGDPRGDEDDSREEEQHYTPPTPAQLAQMLPVAVKQHLDIEKLMTERIERGKLEGSLVDRDEARREFLDAATALGRTLLRQRSTLTARLLSELGLPQHLQQRMAQIVEAEMRQAMLQLATARFGAFSDVEEDAAEPQSNTAIKQKAKIRTEPRATPRGARGESGRRR